MIETIELGKNYQIVLSDIYNGSKFNVNIIGITDIDNVSKNDKDYNIYETYFSPIGLGITAYYTAITKETKIYICSPIKSFSPFNLTDEKIFIPETLIDFSKSSEYVKALNISFNVYPIVRSMISDNTDRDKYISELVLSIKNRLNQLVEFCDQKFNVESNFDTIYMLSEDLEKIESLRESEYLKYINRQSNERNNEKSKELDFNIKYNEMLTAKRNYEQAKIELDDTRERLEAIIRMQN